MPKQILVEEYGDSTTWGRQLINGQPALTANSDPADQQKLLQGRYGSTVTVSNQGVGGTEASQLLNGTDGVHPTWQAQMAASKAQIITLNFGLNDAAAWKVPQNGMIAESPADYANYMTQLVQIAKGAGKQVVLFEPNPTCEPVREPLMPSYVSALQSVAMAQNVPIVSNYADILAMSNWQGLLTDCLHPNDVLYANKAQREYVQALDAMVGAQM